MAPGGSVYQDITESRAALADYDIAPTNMEFRSSSYRKPATVGGKGGMTSNNAVHDLLDCPVCMNSMYPPISQCPNGHTLCQNCKAKVHNVCPICCQELGNIRCLALEKVAESLELPCKYQFLGCEEIFSYQSRLRHEQNCRHRPYNCPYAGAECSVTGDILFLVKHLKDDHNVDMHDGSTFNHRFSNVSTTNFACILRLSILEWRRFTWLSFALWETITMPKNLVTVWKSGDMAGS